MTKYWKIDADKHGISHYTGCSTYYANRDIWIFLHYGLTMPQYRYFCDWHRLGIIFFSIWWK